MNEILMIILFINLISSLIFAWISKRKGQKIYLTVFFIIFPIVGFAIYLIPQTILKLQKNYNYDRDSLVKRYTIRQAESVPVVERELNVVPIEDAMAISNNSEKRELLLEQLKKDIHSNYKAVLPAGGDSDSETAHYVAAAKMEVYRKKHNELTSAKKYMKEHEKDLQAIHEYMDKLEDYIKSELLEEKEARIYKGEYCRVMDMARQIADSTWNAKEYGCYVSYLIDLGREQEAEKFWSALEEENKDEASYFKMLQMYYDLRKKDDFFHCMSQLERSQIRLSPEGLKTLRYWRMKEK